MSGLAGGAATSPDRVAAGDARAGRGFLGHPAGLGVLFATEGFGSFAFYGLQSILVLAMANALLLPAQAGSILGLGTLERWLGAGGTPASQAAMIDGWFGGLIFAAPLVGGVVADRLFGHSRSVVIGLATICCGYALLLVRPLFLLALLLLVVGSGLAGTTKAQLGGLYARDDPRRSNGFQIYAFSVLIAVVFTPLVCGTLAETRGWNWGFGAAAIGSFLGLLVYLGGRRSLERAIARVPAAAAERDAPAEAQRLERRDWLMVGGLMLLLPVLALNSVGNMEMYDGYLLWARAHYDLVWHGHALPVSWLLSLDAFISMGATTVSVAAWTWLDRHGRSVPDLWKITIGSVLCATGVLVLAAAPAHRVGLGWGLAFHVLNDLGNTNTYMVSMAVYSRLAPARLRATVTNACAVQIFLANIVVAQLASRLDSLGGERFWLIHAGLIGLSAAILAALATTATVLRRRRMAGRGQPGSGATERKP